MIENILKLKNAALVYFLKNRYSYVAVFLIIYIVMLFYAAKSTNFFDDEIDSFFISHLPFKTMLHLLAKNFTDDAPLYDLLMGPWICFAGYDIFLLRLPSIFIWVLMIPGIYLCTREMGGEVAALISVSFVFLNPCNWLFPISHNWYPLFAFLSVWNFFFFLRCFGFNLKLVKGQKNLCAFLYILTGTLMWYVCYIAPIYWFSQGFIILICREEVKKKLSLLTIYVGSILLLYLPWLLVFFHLLFRALSPHSMQHSRIFAEILNAFFCIYVLMAGEFSSPLDIVYLLVVVLLFISVLCFIWKSRSEKTNEWFPLLTLVMVFLSMGVIGKLYTKHIIMLTPFLSMYFGLVLGKGSKAGRIFQYLIWMFIGFIFLFSLLNVFHPERWVAYRWTDPFEQVVNQVVDEKPDLILTNFDSVLFHLKDPYGSLYYKSSEIELPVNAKPKALYYPNDFKKYDVLYRTSFCNAQNVVLIYANAEKPISDVYQSDVVDQMEKNGFFITEIKKYAKMNSEFLKFSPTYSDVSISDLDNYRIIVVRYRRVMKLEKYSMFDTGDKIF